MAAGLAEWDGSSIVAQRVDLADESTTRAMLDPDAPASALLAIFRHLGAPVSLDALTDATASLWGISDSFRPVEDPPQQTEPAPLARAEARQFLGAIWAEIRQLRTPHRAAARLLKGMSVKELGAELRRVFQTRRRDTAGDLQATAPPRAL